MKKRLICLGVLVVLLVFAILVVIVPEVRGIFRNMESIYGWARENFYDIYALFRYGDRRFALVSIVFIALFAWIAFGLLKVPAVNDATVAPKAVTQKPIVKKSNGKASIVVVEETEGGK